MQLRSPILVSGLAALALSSTPITAQTWMRDVELNGSNVNIALLPSGELALTLSGSGQNPSRLTLLAPDGEVERAFDFVLPGSINADILAVDADPDGNLVMCFRTFEHSFLVKVDAVTGATLWDHTLAPFLADLTDVVALEDGGTLAVGKEHFDENRGLAMKVDSQGTLEWVRSYGKSHLYRAAESADGGFFLVGSGGVPNHIGGTTVVRTDSAGEILWERAYVDTAILAAKIAPTPDGGAFLVGAYEPTEYDYQPAIVRIDAMGEVVWSRTYPSYPSPEWGVFWNFGDPVAMLDGGCAVVCTQPITDPQIETELTVLRVHANGELHSHRAYGDYGKSANSSAMARTPGGGLVLVARFDGGGMRVVRTDAHGDVAEACNPFDDLGAFTAAIPVQGIEVSYPWQAVPGSVDELHVTPIAASANSTLLCANLCQLFGSSIGFGLVGEQGQIPQLEATGSYCAGDLPSLRVSQARALAPGGMFISGAGSALPLFGGWLWLDPAYMVFVPLITDANGEACLPIYTDLSPWSGLTIYSQAALLDAAAVQGISLTPAATLYIL